MQNPNLLAPVQEMIVDPAKEKPPELAEIFNQYITQSISPAGGKLEKLFEEMQPPPKAEELLNLIVKGDNSQSASNIKGNLNNQFPQIRKKSRRWTPEEDQRLIEAVNSKGIDNWSQIAKDVGGGRTQSQCSQRWHRVLDPKYLKSNWSKEEEEKLINLVSSFGTKAWTKISAKMGNRSDVQCRFRYNFLLKKVNGKTDEIAPIGLPQEIISKNSHANEDINLYDQGENMKE